MVGPRDIKTTDDEKSDVDYGDSIPFRFERTLPQSYSHIVEWLSVHLLDREKIATPRPTVAQEITASFNCILANLIAAAAIGSATFLAIPRGENAYKKSRYNKAPFGYTNAMRALGHLEAVKWVDFKRGFYDRRGPVQRGKRSRYRLTRLGRRILAGYVVIRGAENTAELAGQALINLAERTTARFIGDDTASTFRGAGWLCDQSISDSIRLKDEHRKLIDYEDSKDTKAMRSNLSLWNDFLSQHHIDLLVSDDELLSVFKVEDEEVEEQAFFSDERERPKFIELDRCRLHRVFNNASFKQGGRFYGGWWQRIPSSFRTSITINGHLTRELDYSNLHAAMLYARIGKSLDGDAYSLPNVEPKYRKLIKSTFFKLINAGKDQRIAPPNAAALAPGFSWSQLQDAIIEKHEPIAQYLRSGIGLPLQRIDSNIAESVMLAMMKAEILVLPVHDSFITYHGREADMQREMSRAYREFMKSEIAIDGDLSFLEVWNKDAGPAVEFDAYDVALNIQAQEGFDGYRLRLDNFFKSRPQDWLDRFGEPPI